MEYEEPSKSATTYEIPDGAVLGSLNAPHLDSLKNDTDAANVAGASSWASLTAMPPSLQELRSKIPSDASFTLETIPGKGLGVIATYDISRGTRIWKEAPLLTMEDAYYMAADVQAKFDALDDERKRAFLALASAHGQDPAKWPSMVSSTVPEQEKLRILEQHEARIGKEKSLLSIAMTNAMEMERGAAVFDVASRFNHDCVPNAYFGWNEEMGMETIYAVRDIDKGEEITLSYCDAHLDLFLRRWELDHYDFTCTCRACVPPPAASPDDPTTFYSRSEDRRWRLRDLEDKLPTCNNDAAHLANRIKLLALEREEGICTPTMGETYIQVARICERSGDLAKAVRAAQLGEEYFAVTMGKESRGCVEAGMTVRAFRKALMASMAPQVEGGAAGERMVGK